MHTLSDKFAVETTPSAVFERKEKERKIDVRFEKNKRDIEGAVVVRSVESLNPLSDALRKVRI